MIRWLKRKWPWVKKSKLVASQSALCDLADERWANKDLNMDIRRAEAKLRTVALARPKINMMASVEMVPNEPFPVLVVEIGSFQCRYPWLYRRGNPDEPMADLIGTVVDETAKNWFWGVRKELKRVITETALGSKK